jgi:glycosyltransferase involved in cell wall biosynthesis
VRVLIVSTAFPRYADDPTAKWLVETIRRLAVEGIQFEVLTSAYRGGGNTDFDGIPVHRFRYFFARWERLTHEESAPDRMRRSLFYRLLPVFYLAGGTLAAWRLGRRGNFDIVHVHWPVPHALFGWAAQAGARRRPKLIAHFYSVELRWVKHSLRFLSGFLRRAITSADRVVAISTSTANEIRSIVKVPVEVIPYAVELPSASTTSPPSLRVTPGLSVLSVGRLVERKGVRYLIEALHQLPSELSARLIVIGDGPEREQLTADAVGLGLADRVEFRGWVNPEDLGRAYSEASLFALPAVVDARGDTEGLGMVLLEAMSYGKPVVATPLGGITDIVENERTGLLVPPNNASALANAIERLASDPVLARTLGEAGRDYALTNFSWPAELSKWRALYASVLASPPGARPPRAD